MIYNPKRGDENPAPFTGPPTDEEQNVCAVLLKYSRTSSTTATFGPNFLAVVKMWPLWRGFQKGDWSEWIRSWDRNTWAVEERWPLVEVCSTV